MGKHEKEHRKKVAKRNEQIKLQQMKMKKAQDEFLKKIIENENKQGKFDNNPVVVGPTIQGLNAPILDLNQGPKI
jgi:hypothetical protein